MSKTVIMCPDEPCQGVHSPQCHVVSAAAAAEDDNPRERAISAVQELQRRNAQRYPAGRTITRRRIAEELADAALAALDLPTRDEQMRAEGRAQADNATLWHTTCVNCAGLYDQLMGERERGAAAERDRIAAVLRALTTDGHHSTLIPRDEALAALVGNAPSTAAPTAT